MLPTIRWTGLCGTVDMNELKCTGRRLMTEILKVQALVPTVCIRRIDAFLSIRGISTRVLAMSTVRRVANCGKQTSFASGMMLRSGGVSHVPMTPGNLERVVNLK
jgi:hypothetical protein